MNTRRGAALLSITLVAGLGLAACSSDSEAGPKKDKGGNSKPKQAELTSKNFSKRMNDAQQKAGSAHMSMKVSAQGMDIPMEADVLISDDPKDVKMRMTMSMDALGEQAAQAGVSGDIEMIMIDGEAYMKMGEMTQGKFAKIPASQLDGMGMDQVTSQTNPTGQWDAYSDSLKDFKQEKGEKIDGVDTTKYTLSLDPKKLMEQSGQDGVPDEAADALGDSMDVEMWVGGDDLPRRMKMDMGQAGTTTVDMSKWGEDIKVDKPADDQITDMPGM